jgi:hypothetical protein
MPTTADPQGTPRPYRTRKGGVLDDGGYKHLLQLGQRHRRNRGGEAPVRRAGIGVSQLPEAAGTLLSVDEAAEAERATRVQENVGKVAPGLVQYTTQLLFRGLWLRPGLKSRDRRLVTVSLSNLLLERHLPLLGLDRQKRDDLLNDLPETHRLPDGGRPSSE